MIVDRVEDMTIDEFMARMIGQLYVEDLPPQQVLVQSLPSDDEVVGAWLALRKDSKVSLRVPQRGPNTANHGDGKGERERGVLAESPQATLGSQR